MFQQTIQDVLAITEAGPRPDLVLARAYERIVAFEKVEGAELIVETEAGTRRFVLAEGLGDVGANAFAALGDEATLRFDNVAQMKERAISAPPGLKSVLILRLQSSSVKSAALVMGHSRAWSFAAAPLARLRTLGNVMLRLLAPSDESSKMRPGALSVPARDEKSELMAEVARLRAHVASLEGEVAGLRADQSKKRSGKPR